MSSTTMKGGFMRDWQEGDGQFLSRSSNVLYARSATANGSSERYVPIEHGFRHNMARLGVAWSRRRPKEARRMAELRDVQAYDR